MNSNLAWEARNEAYNEYQPINQLDKWTISGPPGSKLETKRAFKSKVIMRRFDEVNWVHLERSYSKHFLVISHFYIVCQLFYLFFPLAVIFLEKCLLFDVFLRAG